MEFLFLLSLAFIFYTYLGYPLFLSVLALFGKGPGEKREMVPRVSLIISAYNEEKVIEKKLRNALESDYPQDRLEILVASEATDGTNAIVERYASRGVRLRAFAGREGKVATLYRVVPQAGGEILVFSDANSMYAPEAIRRLVRNFADERVGCVCGRLTYRNPNQSAAGQGEMAYWNYETILKKLSSRLSNFSGGAYGAIFALRREAYLPLSKYRGDDFELAVNAAIHGYKTVFEPEAVACEEAMESFGQEFKRKVRIVSWNFISALILLREAFRRRKFFICFQLLSHKIFRWWVPLFLVLLFLSNLGLAVTSGAWFGVLLGAQVLFYLTALFLFFLGQPFLRRLPKILSLPYYFCMVNYACASGVWRSFFHPAVAAWEKTR